MGALEEVNLDSALVFPESYGSVGFRVAKYKIRKVLKGTVKTDMISVFFSIRKSASWVDNPTPRLKPDLFEKSKDYVLMLNPDENLRMLLSKEAQDTYRNEVMFFPFAECWGISADSVENQDKIIALIKTH